MDQMTKVNKEIMFALNDACEDLSKAMAFYSKGSRKYQVLFRLSQAIDKFICTLPIYNDGTPEK